MGPGLAPRISSSAVRASDDERELATAALRRHYAAGRLDHDELEDRLARVVAARTRSDLAAVLADLPRERGLRAMRGFYRFQRALLPVHAGTYAAGNGALIALWEATGQGVFWPGFVLAPTTMMLAGHALGSRALRRGLGLPAKRRERVD
jgi:hypothetical protein